MSKLVSVIIPVYNVEKYLRRCLDSIVNQTYKNLEIILVDDGSTDNCGYICDEYTELDERIKVVHKENGGQGSARNIGLDICRGQYVIFVDSDDWIDLDAVSILVKTIEEKDVDCILFNIYAVYKNGEIETINTMLNCDLDTNEIKHKLFMDYWINSVVDKFYKKSIFNDIRFPINLTYEDAYVMPEILQKINKMIYISKSLYYYDRSNMDSTTKIIKAKNLYDIFKGWQRKSKFRSVFTDLEIKYCLEKMEQFAKESLYLNLIDQTLSKGQTDELKKYVYKSIKGTKQEKLIGLFLYIKYKIKKKTSNNRLIWKIWRKYINSKK